MVNRQVCVGESVTQTRAFRVNYNIAALQILLFMYITDPNPCDGLECGEGSECQIFEPTGEAFCNPNCEDLNPCGPHQVCTLQPVICKRAPCPPALLCVDRKLINFYTNYYIQSPR